ncbi:hypothetical protein ABMA28_012010 [Loxostege sticticalis]|uniref:dolichyl-phosphate-mannose--protein mannosyltransferase n=1 Tax=Loxostege sticticalis TaxID=481309 RepID=A0ABD0TLM4_LOXSC
MTFKLLGLVFLSSFPFLFTLNGDFVFDDSEAILKNKDITSESWIDCFYNDFWGTDIKSNLSHKSYRPLTIISFRLNYILNGKQLTAFPYKLTNLLCHVLCSILAWKVFENILKTHKNGNKSSKEIDISFLAALLFAVHPIHVEAVCGVVGRADLLCGVTFFTAFLLYHKATTSYKSSYIILLLCIIMAAISMLCKENGVTVLGFCILYDLSFMLGNKRKQKKDHNNCSNSYIRITMLCISIVLLLYGRWSIMGGTKPEFKSIDNPAAFADNWFSKVASFNYIYFLNLLLLLWPQWLSYDWSMGCVPLVKSVQDMRLIWVFLVYIYAVLFVIAMFRTKNKIVLRPLVLSVALAVIPFLPAANIFYPVGFVIAERILYIPSAGYCLLIVMGLNKIIMRSNKQKVALFFYIFLLISLGLRSWQRSYDWQNEYQLFMDGLSVCPLNAKVHYNVAKVADANNKTDFALHSYKESLRLFPEYYQAMNNLANLLKNQKMFSEAEKYLRQALRHKKDFPAAWMNLGIVLASTKRLEESQNAYKTALQYRKKYPDCFYNLGNLYLEMNRTHDAMENWLHAVQLNSKHVLAWTNLIALLDNTEQIDKALQVIPKALKELPDSPSINFAVGNIYGKMGQFAEAEQYFLKAIKLFGARVQAIHYANLGVLYHRWKRYDLAEAMYQNALRIDNKFKSAINNLKSIQKVKRKIIN